MRVLYVIDSLVPGGAEKSLADLAPHYIARGVELDVVYLHDRPGLHNDLTQAGARLVGIDGSGGRLARLARLRRLVAERSPDLIHTTLFEADLIGRTAALLTGRVVVSSLVNPAYGSGHIDDPALRAWRVRIAQLLDAASARRVRRFHATSHYVKRVMSRRLRIRDHVIDVIPRGRDPGRLGSRTSMRADEVRRQLGVVPDERLVVAVARHERQKGLDILIRAFRRVLSSAREARLLVAGRPGNQTAKLRDVIRELRLDDQVHLLGHRDDVADILCAADAFVVPSRWEGFGGVLLEAMALEAPIVVSDLEAVREVLPDEDYGWLVTPEQPDLLAASIVHALTDRKEAIRRASNARRRFHEHFTIERVTHQMVSFYERALDR